MLKRKSTSLLFIILFVVFTTTAQSFKFGKVSKEALQEKFYELDSTADAAYLHKERKSYYQLNSKQDGFDVVTEVAYRLKIYTKDGFKHATQVIPYYHPEVGDNEKISSLKGYSFTMNNGKVEKTKLKNKDVFKEQVNKFWSNKKISMPNIKEGSIIDIKYKVLSPYYSKIDDMNFQYSIPVKYLNYYIEIPEFYKFKLLTKGYYPIAPQTTTKNSSVFFTSSSRSGSLINSTNFSREELEYLSTQYNFNGNNIPALKDDEPFVNNIANYRGGVKFELSATDFIKIGGTTRYYTSTWEDVAKQIFKMKSFGDELNKFKYFEDDLNTILSKSPEVPQKVANIFQFVKSKVKWNGYYGKTTNKGVKKAYKEGTGNAAEINLILTAMLRKAGLASNPVLISTRNNGKPLFPTIDGFNYVISLVEFANGSYVLLDATEPYSLPNVLPERDLNWNGRLVNRDGRSSWIKLTSNKPAVKENFASVKITDDFMVEGMVRTKFENLDAVNYRIANNHIKNEDVITSLENRFNIEIDNFRVANERKIGKPLTRMAQFVSEDLIESISGKLYIKPLLFLGATKNPFKLENRKFPVNFSTPWKEVNKITIQIPEGYKIESTPETIAKAMPENLGVFKFQILQTGNKLRTVSSIEFSQATIPVKFYPILKKFYGEIVAKQSEKIVISKI